jgi:glycosyltransferase involved in cell wall biosynthesis
MTVKAIFNELARDTSFKVGLINTSPVRDVRENANGFHFEKVKRCTYIVRQFVREVPSCDVVLLFANNLFATIMLPILLPITVMFQKKLFIKPIGGDMDTYLQLLPRGIRFLFKRILCSIDGILAQTRLLQNRLRSMGLKNVFYLPGFRTLQGGASRGEFPVGERFRIIFLGHIIREKGPLVLLQAMQYLQDLGNTNIFCDFYGPIHHNTRKEFLHRLHKIRNAKYCGCDGDGSGSRLIAKYHCLVLPTFFECEGHPGVIIEAMHAGIPVISTDHLAIPELVSHRKNGLLVPPNDVISLSSAIEEMASNTAETERMGRENWKRGHEFSSKTVVREMIEIIFNQPGLFSRL